MKGYDKTPIFSSSLLHPRYGLIWFGISLLYLLVLLPYPVLYQLGTWFGHLAQRFMSHRVKIATRNLELCFPKMPPLEREALLRRNFESVGMGLIETGMAWFWPDWRIKRWFKVSGLEHMLQARKKRKGIL